MLVTTTDSLSFSDTAGQNKTDIWTVATGSRKPRQRRPRILVVDDEMLIADTVAEILQGAGFEVATAYNGWTALEEAGTFHPDYLLADILMPKMNGVDLAIAIRKMYPTARILLFSGQAGITDILRIAQDQGFRFELIAKPVHPLALIERLREL